MYHTRIAPSPTGNLHLGTARTAYFNWLASRASGGKFILRIDDTDQERSKQEFVDDILSAMEWLGLDYDEIVYQSHRLEKHKEKVQELVDQGLATMLPDGAAKLNTENLEIPEAWVDEVSGEISITEKDRESIDNLILLRRDGFPTYHFSTVVDDVDLGINFIIRGVDHISNTSKHVALYVALGYQLPKFAHVGLIHKDKKKMSKRDGVAGVISYKEEYDPDALLNFLLRMGWGPSKDDKSTSVLPKERALELFLEGGRMRSAAANFDQAKLDSFNRKYKAKKRKQS